MPGDMVVALGRSTVDHATLFGHNSDRPAGECPRLQLVPGRSFSVGETIQTQFLKLPQVRQTLTVLGCQPTAARHSVFRAVKKLRRALEPLVGTAK